MIDVSKQLKTDISKNIVLVIIGKEELVIPNKESYDIDRLNKKG